MPNTLGHNAQLCYAQYSPNVILCICAYIFHFLNKYAEFIVLKNHFLAYPRSGRQNSGSHPKISERGFIYIFNLRTEQPSDHAADPQDLQQRGFLPHAELSLEYKIRKDPKFYRWMEMI